MKPGMKMLAATMNRETGDGRRKERGNARDHYPGEPPMDRGGDMRHEGGDMRAAGMPYQGTMRHGVPVPDYGGRYGGGYSGYGMEEGSWEDMRFRDRSGRRRYNDGRFAPENRYYPPEYGGDDGLEEMDRYAGDTEPPGNNYPQRRRGGPESRIGFSMDGEPQNGETLTFPGQHMAHQGKGRRLDKETAEGWVAGMKNEDGTKGAHWTMEQTEQVRRQKNLDCDPVEFWVAMNAAYSDLCKVAKKYNTNTVDYYVDYVKAYWFNDQDAVPHKLAAYYDFVVKK